MLDFNWKMCFFPWRYFHFIIFFWVVLLFFESAATHGSSFSHKKDQKSDTSEWHVQEPGPGKQFDIVFHPERGFILFGVHAKDIFRVVGGKPLPPFYNSNVRWRLFEEIGKNVEWSVTNRSITLRTRDRGWLGASSTATRLTVGNPGKGGDGLCTRILDGKPIQGRL